VFYWKGPRIRECSKFAQTLSNEKYSKTQKRSGATRGNINEVEKEEKHDDDVDEV
jgi:hypothetical protein